MDCFAALAMTLREHVRQIGTTGKISVFPKPKSGTYSACLTRQRGVGRRHERCGGMRWTLKSRRRAWRMRTAKSCGSAPEAGVKLRRFIPGAAMVAIERVSPGRPRYKP